MGKKGKTKEKREKRGKREKKKKKEKEGKERGKKELHGMPWSPWDSNTLPLPYLPPSPFRYYIIRELSLGTKGKTSFNNKPNQYSGTSI